MKKKIISILGILLSLFGLVMLYLFFVFNNLNSSAYLNNDVTDYIVIEIIVLLLLLGLLIYSIINLFKK